MSGTCSLLLVLSYAMVTNAYRLNVPRVLLPYHPTVQVKFFLMVSDPSNGCFNWRTTRPDVISVEILNPKGRNGCSAEAQITVTSKHPEKQTAVVLVEDKGITLSCGVTVDVIRSIAISTTTKVLFLDASPAKIAIQAFNAEGDIFTSLGEIPFEWHLEASKHSSLSEMPLRIVPFSQSKYEAPNGVRLLEEKKKRGWVILVEGLSTGTAVLKVKLVESHFKEVEFRSIELVVVANLILVPSQDVYLPLGSVVRYSAEIVRQSSTEKINLPSKQYHLVIEDQKICSLDPSKSEVTAINFGTTKISLIDENVKLLSASKPPSARIHVVEPSVLSLRISGDSWYLEKNREYHISMIITDSSDNVMYIPKNAYFEITIPTDYFKIISKSQNGSYIHVKTIESGNVVLQATFVSIVGWEKDERLLLPIKDEVVVTISEPIEILPSFVAYPYISDKSIHSTKLMAQGGTGSFTWSSLDPNVAIVDSSGVLFSGKLGETEVIAEDALNSAHFGKAVVQVLRPTSIAFGKSRLEAKVGSDLILYVSMRANVGDTQVTISDCRHVDFLVKVKDNNIFRLVSGAPRELSPYRDGCSSFVLKAVSSGDTIVTIHFETLSASTQISSYSPLKLKTSTEVLALLGSKFFIRTFGGPRPWILDSSKYFSRLIYSNTTNLISSSSQDEHIITCKQNKGDIAVLVVVGNEPSFTNPLPATAEVLVRVCCSIPSRLSLSVRRSYNSSCPADVRAISSSHPSILAISAFGYCESGPLMGIEKQFDSLTSLVVKWSVSDMTAVTVKQNEEHLQVDEVYGVLNPLKQSAGVKIMVSTTKYRVGRQEQSLSAELQSSILIDLVDNAEAVPSTVILLNEKRARKAIHLQRGSGHFALMIHNSTVLDAVLSNGVVEVHPLAVGKSEIGFTDICFNYNFTAMISITDVEEILIRAPEYQLNDLTAITHDTLYVRLCTLVISEDCIAEGLMKFYRELHLKVALNEEQEVQLKIRDLEGTLFVPDDADIINVQLNASTSAVTITKVDALHYVLRGIAVGVVTIRATARRASGRLLQSHSHSIQVYTPLQLQPKVITLIPNSVFQLEIFGGPQPLPPVRYRLNNTSIASVTPSGLVTSKTIGYAKITGSVFLENSVITEDEVILKTVLLAGIRMRLSTSRIQIGEKAWARVEGLADDETPFSFAGALHPLRFSWTTTTSGIVEIVSPFNALMSESVENFFQVELKALREGQTVIRVSVIVSPDSKAFFDTVRVADDQLAISVIKPLELAVPPRYPIPIRLSPDAELELISNRKDNSVQFMVPPDLTNHLTVVGEGNSILRARVVGDATVMMKDTKDTYKETIYLPVSVTPVTSLHLEVRCSEVLKKMLPVMPLGYRLHVDVKSRDHLGRLFDSAKHSLCYRPHRFDLTEIHPTNDNYSFEIQLKEMWDRNNQELSVYLRLPVGDVIEPQIDKITVSEIICFKSPLSLSDWQEVDAERNFQFVERNNGIAVAVDVGNGLIVSYTPDKQTIFTRRKVIPAKALHFSSVPQFISNIKGYQYVLPVIVNSGEKNPSNVYGMLSLPPRNILHIPDIGCSSSTLETVKLDAPFDCTVNFVGGVDILASSLLTASSAFLPKINKYGCIIKEQTFERPFALLDYDTLDLNIIAVWNRAGKVEQASVTVTFYPRFEVVQREIRLDNVNTMEADLQIHSSKLTANRIIVESSATSILHIKQVKSSASTLLHYHVALDMHSAFLWQELLDKCNVTVKSTITGQLEVIPVSIVLHGDASKAVLHASNSLLELTGAFLESTIVQVCTSLLTAALIALLIAHCKGYSLSSYWFSSVHDSDSTLGSFSKGHPDLHSHLISPGRKSTWASTDISSLSANSRSSRSAGSLGEPILWSVSDQMPSPDFIKRRPKI